MELASYRVLASLGSGRDGSAFLAEAPGAPDPVELRILADLAGDADRKRRLAKDLPLAKLLEHPSALRVIDLDLTNEPPFIVVERREPPSAESWQHRSPMVFDELLGLALLLSDLVSAAHRIGLTIGRLRPDNLLGPNTGEIQIDCAGVDCRLDTPAIASSFADDCGYLGDLFRHYLVGDQALPAATIPAITGQSEVYLRFADLITEMRNPNVDERPSLREVFERVAALPDSVTGKTGVLRAPARTQTADLTREEEIQIVRHEISIASFLGRFRLIEKIGQGGMGAVYRAEDVSNGTQVAIKVLRPDMMRLPTASRRLGKEARLLAQVNNPYVTNLLEVNEDNGIHYLVMEFVAGQDLGKLLTKNGPLPEIAALGILTDVARALTGAHQRGIVHRDIKPENIIVLFEADAESFWNKGSSADRWGSGRPTIKLADFGLARTIDQSESLNITVDGTAVGTPLYMAPEQAMNVSTITARSDIYSMGATLFHMLTGRPPFIAESCVGLMAMHRDEQLPNLQRFNPNFSDALCQVVARAMEKDPEARQADAAELLVDLEHLLRGKPTALVVHPQPPIGNARRVIEYEWSWELDATPEELWPHVSNTERFNRAIGLPAVQYSTENRSSGGVRRLGRFRKFGIVAAWEEHPFEWIEGRRMGILREYSSGVLKWMTSEVEMEPRAGGGTLLTQRIRLETMGLLGRIAAAIEIGRKVRRAADRVYRRMDAAITGKLGNPTDLDPFESSHQLSRFNRSRLESLLDRLIQSGLDPDVVHRLGDYLAEAPPQDVSRIRPLELARRFKLDPDQTISACLRGANVGLLTLLWDILCPRCRISCSIQDTIKAIREHAHCATCNSDFPLDFSSSVEMVFRVHPQIRIAETGMYCIGGPAHLPHVAAQVRLAAGERFELAVTLKEGHYLLRGPQLPYSVDIRIQRGARLMRWELDLERGPVENRECTLGIGTQYLLLNNPLSHEIVVRVERAWSADVLTAARATSLPLFRQLFPNEILSPGQLIFVATMTMVATYLDDVETLYRELGDSQVVSILHEQFRLLEECARGERGAIVKTVHNGILAAFPNPADAVRSALAMQQCLRSNANTRNLQLCVAVHLGPTHAATLNNRIEYFGQTVEGVVGLARKGIAGEVLITDAVAVDPQVATYLQSRGLVAGAPDRSFAKIAGRLIRNMAETREQIEPLAISI